MPTLMLPIRGKPNPYAFQVSQEIFERFIHLEEAFELDPSVIDQIEAAIRVFHKRKDRLGKQKTTEEINAIAAKLFS